MFWISRYGLKDFAQKKLSNYPKAQEYEGYLTKNAFMGILLVRLVPIIPSPVVNIVSAISHVFYKCILTWKASSYFYLHHCRKDFC
jgi:uncharacterized membrane protein YdjX (TVP38/TMEM64 family)